MALASRSMGHSTRRCEPPLQRTCHTSRRVLWPIRHCEPPLRRGNSGAARTAAVFPWTWIVAEQCAPRWRLKARPSAVRLDPKRSKGQANCFVIPARTSFDPLAPAAKGRPSRVGTRSRLVRTGISLSAKGSYRADAATPATGIAAIGCARTAVQPSISATMINPVRTNAIAFIPPRWTPSNATAVNNGIAAASGRFAAASWQAAPARTPGWPAVCNPG